MKQHTEIRIRRIALCLLFFPLLAFCLHPLYRQQRAEKEGELCRITLSIPHGILLCEGRYLHFQMPRRVRGEFDASGHGFVLLPPQNSPKESGTWGKVSPEKPLGTPCFLRVVRASRWWDDTISEPFDTFFLPRALTAAEKKRLGFLALRRKWQLLLRVKDGYASPAGILIDGIPLLQRLEGN